MILRRANGSGNAAVRVNAMMQEIASRTVTSAEYVRSSGGWGSICSVYRRSGTRPANVGLFSWCGMIRTA